MYRMPFDDGLGVEVVEIAGEVVVVAGAGTELASAASWLEAAGAVAAVAAVASCIADGHNIRYGQVQPSLVEAHHVALTVTGSDLS